MKHCCVFLWNIDNGSLVQSHFSSFICVHFVLNIEKYYNKIHETIASKTTHTNNFVVEINWRRRRKREKDTYMLAMRTSAVLLCIICCSNFMVCKRLFISLTVHVFFLHSPRSHIRARFSLLILIAIINISIPSANVHLVRSLTQSLSFLSSSFISQKFDSSF